MGANALSRGRLLRNQPSGHEYDLTASATSREILIGFADIGQTIDLGDRDLEAASVDQARKFREHLGIRRRAVLGRSSKCQIGSKIAYSWQCDIAVMRAAQKGIVHPNAARAKSLAAQAD